MLGKIRIVEPKIKIIEDTMKTLPLISEQQLAEALGAEVSSSDEISKSKPPSTSPLARLLAAEIATD
jgi:hypothetical protein